MTVNPADEQRHLAHITQDLRREFAAVPEEVVDGEVAELLRSFQQAPVRSFIPTLVHRGARQRLRHYA